MKLIYNKATTKKIVEDFQKNAYPSRVTLLVSTELISWTITLVYWMFDDSSEWLGFMGSVAGRWAIVLQLVVKLPSTGIQKKVNEQ